MKSDTGSDETRIRPGLGVAPGRANGAGGMRAAGDLAGSHWLAADDVQHLSGQSAPRAKAARQHSAPRGEPDMCQPRDAGRGGLGHSRGAGVLGGRRHGRGRLRLGLRSTKPQIRQSLQNPPPTVLPLAPNFLP